MRDIQTTEDIAFIMKEFYTVMLKDEQIGYIFTDVAKLDLEKHLPSLTNFWENILLKANGYKKNVMDIHLKLNEKEHLKPEHFTHWLALLSQTVLNNYEGEKANQMLQTANNIATVMQYKINFKNT